MRKSGLVVLALGLLAGMAPAAIAGDPASEAGKPDSVAIEVILPPKITRFPTGNLYPMNDVNDGREG